MNTSDLLDLRTMLFCLAFSNLMLAILMSSHALQGNSQRIALSWAGGRGLQGLALALFWLRGVVPDTLSIPVACSLLVIGVAIESRAIQLYWEFNRFERYFLPVSAISVILLTTAWATGLPPGVRIAIIAAFGILAFLPICHIYWKSWRTSSLTHRLNTLATTTIAIVLVLCLGEALLERQASLYSPGISQVLTIIPLFLLVVFSGFAFLLEIHERTEKKLQASESLLERAQNIARVSSWTVDLSSGLLSIHRAGGKDRTIPTSGDPIADLFEGNHPDDLPQIKSAWLRALAKKTPFDIMHRVSRNGRIHWFHSRAEIESDQEGRPIRGTGVSRDVTELREIQESLETYQRHLEKLVAARSAELREAEARTRLFLDSTAEGMLGADTDGRITFANQAACALLGQEAGKLVGSQLATALGCDIMSGNGEQASRPFFAETLKSGESAHCDELYFRHGDGHLLPVACSTQPMWRDGQLIGAVLNFSDITPQISARQAREQALREAQRLASVRSEFIANMSHEIRTPLNAVLGLAQLGARGESGLDALTTFKRIQESGRHLLNVVNDILDFSKIEAGKLVLENERVLTAQLIDGVVGLTAAQAESKGLKLTVEESADLPSAFRGDSMRLLQVLLNLVSNAIKFTERGHVTLSARVEADHLCFRVADSGIGMDKEQVSRLFNAFEQGDNTTTRRFGGTGLGLSISKRLMTMMGGEIFVSSRPGEGSTFEIHLPLIDAESAAHNSLPANTVRIAGFDENDARWLVEQFNSLHIHPTLVPHTAAFFGAADWVILHGAALTDPNLRRAVAKAQNAGNKVIIVVPPGGAQRLDNELLTRSAMVEEPLRFRHLLAAMQAPTATGQTPTRNERRLTGLRILAAEDHPVNQLVLNELLTHEGAELVCVDDGRQAVERVADDPHAFDLVLTDIQMPEMDGYEATRRILAIAPDLPVIGLTAHAMQEEKARCLNAGMVAHVAKPIDIESLIEVIRTHAVGRTSETIPLAEQRTLTTNMPLVIDWQSLMTRFAKEPTLIERLVISMIQTTTDTPEKLRQLAEQREFDKIASIAHRLKGACATLDACRVSTLASETEALARAGSEMCAEHACRLADAVTEMLSELYRYKFAA